jgi:hypothetical protein
VAGHPERPKKKTTKMGLGFWGWPDHPQGPGGWLKPPPTTGRWCPKPPPTTGRCCPKPPPGPRCWSGHPIRPVWGGRPPLGQKWGGPSTPFFGQGVAPATPISPFFFFFFNFLLFFKKKKKKKNPKICKTTPFCPKQRRFGQAQNGVVLE